MLKRIIKWIPNHPPVSIVQDQTKRECEFCGESNSYMHFYLAVGEFTICYACFAKAMRKVLAPKEK